MTNTATAAKPTRAQVARWSAIRNAKKTKAQTETPVEGEVVKMPRKFALDGVAPFDAMISFTSQTSGVGTNGNAYTTLKGVEFAIDGETYTRTCMAFGKGSDLVQAEIAKGTSLLEVQLTPNRNTMLITGIVVDGEFVTIESEAPASAEAEGRAAA